MDFYRSGQEGRDGFAEKNLLSAISVSSCSLRFFFSFKFQGRNLRLDEEQKAIKPPHQELAFNCSCILRTRSASFSEVKFSRMLSTLMGKQNGV